MIRVLVFGTFDGLHEGHRKFLHQARAHGDQLVVAVARDEVVEQLKGRPPQHPLSERVGELQRAALADLVIEGDAELGTYNVITKYKPNVIALGYDQDALKEDLRAELNRFNWHLELITLDPHEPEKYHSSILRDNNKEEA